MQYFWDEGTAFRRLFDRKNLTHTLELACGHGRHDERFRGLTSALTMKDINQSNVAFCLERFKDEPGFNVLKNNRMDFQPDAAASIIALFCYATIVHFDHRWFNRIGRTPSRWSPSSPEQRVRG